MSAKETVEDDIGRIFCKLHGRDVCHECCMDFRPCNRLAEERSGQRKTRTELEDLAEQKVMLQNGLAHMRNMGSPPEMAGNIKFHETELAIVEGKIAAALAAGGDEDDLHRGARAERDIWATQEAEKNAVLQQWVRDNPGKTRMPLGGAEHQRLFDQFAASAPTVPNARAPEKHTCAWCRKAASPAHKLHACAGCSQAYYCNKTCQKAAWKGHKKACKEAQRAAAGQDESAAVHKPAKRLPLTWAQLEKYGAGVPAEGKVLEVRVLADESLTRTVFSCKDRVGVVKRIAAYTDSRRLPGVASGKVLRWKHPRFHYFMDGSAGARIEEGDLKNLTIT